MLRKTIKKADLEGANAIKAAIEDLRASSGPGASSGLVGKWAALKSILEFTADGKAKNLSNGDAGNWRETREGFLVQWDNGWQHLIVKNIEGFTGQFQGPKGEVGAIKYVPTVD